MFIQNSSLNQIHINLFLLKKSFLIQNFNINSWFKIILVAKNHHHIHYPNKLLQNSIVTLLFISNKTITQTFILSLGPSAYTYSCLLPMTRFHIFQTFFSLCSLQPNPSTSSFEYIEPKHNQTRAHRQPCFSL